MLKVIDCQVVYRNAERVGELDSSGVNIRSQCGGCYAYYMHGGFLLDISVIQQDMPCGIHNQQNNQDDMEDLACFHNMQM